MKYGYARVSTDGQSVTAQVAALRKHGAGKVFREVASGAKTDRAQLRRVARPARRRRRADGDTARPAGAIDPRPAEHARGDHRQESRFQIHWRRMGRHHDIARAVDADRARRAGGVRARPDPRAHRRRPGARRGARAENGPTAEADAAPAARGDQAPRHRARNRLPTSAAATTSARRRFHDWPPPSPCHNCLMGKPTGIMKPRRFKYFSKRDHADEFLDGKVLCRMAAFFRDYEDALAQQIIGDEYEGARLYRPLGGLEINNLTRNRSFTLDAGMECLTKAHEIYIFCMSLSFSDVLKKEFAAVACAEILDPRAFISRWLNALPEEAKQRKSTLPGGCGITSRKMLRATCGPCQT